MPYKIGDIVHFSGAGHFANGIDCIVLETDPEDGRITKMKATIPDPELGKIGFFLEGEDYVPLSLQSSPNRIKRNAQINIILPVLPPGLSFHLLS